MRQPKYRYNTKTLRYERVSFSIWRFLSSIVAYGAFACIFFVLLSMLENALIETEEEKSLKKENAALLTYKASLTQQLTDSRQLLATLREKEATLYESLFESPAEKPTERTELTPDLDDMAGQIDYLRGFAHRLQARAAMSRDAFAMQFNLRKIDIARLFNAPSGMPVANITPDHLISGFGIRINPFHKGKYHHDGVDLSFTKGTEVLATGSGQITNISLGPQAAGPGNYVEIDHGNGLITRYAHLQDITVSWGQKIKKGQTIGTVGSTGGSAAPHLHYEVVKNGKSVNPMIYMVDGLDAQGYDQLVLKSKKLNQSLD